MKYPNTLKRKAAASGMSRSAYAKKNQKATDTTGKQARLDMALQKLRMSKSPKTPADAFYGDSGE